MIKKKETEKDSNEKKEGPTIEKNWTRTKLKYKHTHTQTSTLAKYKERNVKLVEETQVVWQRLGDNITSYLLAK